MPPHFRELLLIYLAVLIPTLAILIRTRTSAATIGTAPLYAFAATVLGIVDSLLAR